MKITALVENTTIGPLKSVHGLSLHIKTQNHTILFDLGPNDTIFENAKILGIDLAEVDIVIISHGHTDHAGCIDAFLQLNSSAKIYIQKRAFDAYYSVVESTKDYIGLDTSLKNHEQIILLDGDYTIDDELSLFVVGKREKCYSTMNDFLYKGDEPDDFLHEQNLLIHEEKTALIIGCGHSGVVNIMEAAVSHTPAVCVGGFHLFSFGTNQTVPDSVLNAIVTELQSYPNTQFFTCHCTGEDAFAYLSKYLSNMFYLSCGDVIDV